MPLKLYAHPFSSYSWKVLIWFYETGTPFEPMWLQPETPQNFAELTRLWPIQKFPLLVDGDRVLQEASTILEYLELRNESAHKLLPADPVAAIEVRRMDRILDAYVMQPMQKIVMDKLRPEGDRDAFGVTEARKRLTTIYSWLNVALHGRTWAAGDTFTLADCSAAPSLFYADWAEPIPEHLTVLKAYRTRALKRPSIARAVDEARPYRHYFPLGAPYRD